MVTRSLDGGFTDPVLQSQGVFHALMHALANPGMRRDMALSLAPPSPLTAELAAVALTLCDHDTLLWLDPGLANAAVLDWLRFHTGAPIIRQRDLAAFAFCQSGALELSQFQQGTDFYPDRSTTIVLPVSFGGAGEALDVSGPGIDGAIALAVAGLPPDFPTQWHENMAQFPRGVDLLLVGDGQVVGLPRTTRIMPKDW